MTDVPAWLGTLDASVLNAKLSIPEPRADAVSRADLIEKARTSDCRVVGITAPAGYGKSTLLAEWAEAEDRRVAWVSLDRFDDDPASFVMLMGSAYARVSPENPELLADLSGLGTSVLGRAAPRLASAFRTSPSPFLFVLDDLHELQSPDCHDALEVVIAGVPQGSQLVAASRSEQPHLPRLRASGDTLELGVSHLALDSTGATQIFDAASIRLDQQTAIALTERTEGWPVGLYLAAMVAKERGNEALTISGDDRFVTDYLYRESISRLPDADQRFLRWTAVLDHIVRAAVRCHPRRIRIPTAAAAPGDLELVPGPARPTARVVPIPRPLPGVPARRTPPHRARRRRQDPPPCGRLVRDERVPRHGGRASPEHR